MSLNFHFLLVTLFVVCFVFSLLINHIMLRFAQTLGIRNRNEDQIRWNPETKPSLGGISFFLIFLFAFIFATLVQRGEQVFPVKMIGILVAATLAFLMGLADDAFNTQPLLKFMTQLFCALILIFCGHSIAITDNRLINYALTVIWVVGVMNSINMLDNMDGITCIVSILACSFMVAVNISARMAFGYSTMLNLGVLGALCGFIFYNFHPSRMFMGDTGSQFLGLFLSVMGIEHAWNNPFIHPGQPYPLINILLVCLVFLLPITDTTTVVINRLWRGQSPFVGGKDHTTHHLFFRGITEKRIALMYFAIGAAGIWMAYMLIIRYSFTLLNISIAYFAVVFLTLYLNTVIRRRQR
jgi:UDP-GlcNAc:undecaprenyl-phosphate/decaprenyl-phosphate GlcNAc-1-phosphate transferase